jgi:hypothetical protein
MFSRVKPGQTLFQGQSGILNGPNNDSPVFHRNAYTLIDM